MNINTKRGFLSLEASIFVPVFIIAVLTFGYLIKVAITAENVMHIMADEARKLSMYSYNIKVAPMFAHGLESRLLEESEDLDDARVESFRYLYNVAGKEDFIGFRVSGTIKIKLPIVFHDSVDISDTLFMRAFTGREFIPEKISFEDMEEDEEARTVWVFPRAGEKYHDADCGYINVAARQATLNTVIKRVYDPCTLCGAGEAPFGSVIYYFDKSGKVYHNGSCFTVDRYVVSMDEEDAKRKGYAPCRRCI